MATTLRDRFNDAIMTEGADAAFELAVKETLSFLKEYDRAIRSGEETFDSISDEWKRQSGL